MRRGTLCRQLFLVLLQRLVIGGLERACYLLQELFGTLVPPRESVESVYTKQRSAQSKSELAGQLAVEPPHPQRAPKRDLYVKQLAGDESAVISGRFHEASEIY